MILNDEKNDWVKTLAYFTNLYTMRKLYSEDRATESRFEITANVTHISPLAIIINAFFNMNRVGPMGIITMMQ